MSRLMDSARIYDQVAHGSKQEIILPDFTLLEILNDTNIEKLSTEQLVSFLEKKGAKGKFLEIIKNKELNGEHFSRVDFVDKTITRDTREAYEISEKSVEEFSKICKSLIETIKLYRCVKPGLNIEGSCMNCKLKDVICPLEFPEEDQDILNADYNIENIKCPICGAQLGIGRFAIYAGTECDIDFKIWGTRYIQGLISRVKKETPYIYIIKKNTWIISNEIEQEEVIWTKINIILKKIEKPKPAP